jgi:hypothetical protein
MEIYHAAVLSVKELFKALTTDQKEWAKELRTRRHKTVPLRK